MEGSHNPILDKVQQATLVYLKAACNIIHKIRVYHIQNQQDDRSGISKENQHLP